MKYKLGEKHPTENLYRVVALKDFGNVKQGDIGGWVGGEYNLAHDGDCWVSGNARVSGYAQVYEDAQVSGNARVFGDALVFGEVLVYGDVRVYGDARVSGYAQVYGNCAPPKREWVGLTHAEIKEIYKAGWSNNMDFAQAIEAKLKEKNA